MSNEDLITYLRDLGLRVEILEVTGAQFIAARDYVIPSGSLTGQTRDVAIQWSDQVPYVPLPAVHVRPHVVAMGQRNSMASALGADWQYLSRILRVAPTPKAWVTHINTVLAEL